MAFACSDWAEEIAKLKGHNSKQWLVLGLLFGPIALIALAAYPDLEDRKHQRDSAAELSLIKDDIDAISPSQQGFCCCSEYSHPSPPAFSGTS